MFTPTGVTQSATPATAANSLIALPHCDGVAIYNSGTVLVFAGFATKASPYGATPVLVGGMPIPPGQSIFLGVPGVIGNQVDPVNQLALLALAGSAGIVYVTPGRGTLT